jgi:hypothetical protein
MNIRKSGTGKDDDKRYLIETHYRQETDLQLWKVEKVSNRFLDCDDSQPHLGGLYDKTTVAIVTISGLKSMDLGGRESNSLIQAEELDMANSIHHYRRRKGLPPRH